MIHSSDIMEMKQMCVSWPCFFDAISNGLKRC